MVGDYRKVVTFHWDWGSGHEGSLRFVTVEAEVAAPSYAQQYLYTTKGQLIFALVFGGYEARTVRHYFQDKELVAHERKHGGLSSLYHHYEAVAVRACFHA